MQDDNNIKFFSEDEIKKEENGRNQIYILIFSILTVSILFMTSLSFFSVTAVRKCEIKAKNEAASFERFERDVMMKSNSSFLATPSVTEAMMLNKCLKSNFLTQNVRIILSATFNYLSILFLVSFYLIVFKKNRKIISLGKAIIISIIIIIALVLKQTAGLAGLIISPIIAYLTVKKVLGTDIFGAIIFVTIIGFLNWMLLNFIAKIFT